MRVLVLESDGALRRALAREARHRNADVVLVSGVPEALEQLSRANFDGVSIDLRAPRYRGMRLLKTLRSRSPEIALVGTAGRPVQGELRTLDESSAVFLPKPYGVDSLLGMIERLRTPEAMKAAERPPIPLEPLGSGIERALSLRPGLRAVAIKALSDDEFPVLDPRTAGLQRLMSEDDCSIDALVGLLESDIHITASILARANTAAIRGSGEFTTLREACVRIGTRETFAVSLRTLMDNTFPVPDGRYGDMLEGSWRIARMSATFGRELARLRSLSVPEELFVAGLMVNIGELFGVWLLSRHPVLGDNRDHEELVHCLSKLGQPLGRALRKRWSLPQRLHNLLELDRSDDMDHARNLLKLGYEWAMELDSVEDWVFEESELAPLLIKLGGDGEWAASAVRAARIHGAS